MPLVSHRKKTSLTTTHQGVEAAGSRRCDVARREEWVHFLLILHPGHDIGGSTVQSALRGAVPGWLVIKVKWSEKLTLYIMIIGLMGYLFGK